MRTSFKFLYVALIVCDTGRAGAVKAKQEAEAKAKHEAVARQEAEALKAEQEAEAKAKQEAVARQEAEALKAKQEAEAKAKHEAVLRQEAEALKAKQEAEAKAKQEIGALARQEAIAKAKRRLSAFDEAEKRRIAEICVPLGCVSSNGYIAAGETGTVVDHAHESVQVRVEFSKGTWCPAPIELITSEPCRERKVCLQS